MKVGFIGLGIMGSRMAANLLSAGNELVVYNRTRAHAEPLLEKGATWGENPMEVARQVDVLFTMLSTPEVVESMALGQQGFLIAMHQGTYWIDCSTVNPTFTRRMARAASQSGVRFLDAPVVGSKVPIETRDVTLLVGGDEKDLDAVRPLLEAVAKKITYAGSNGMGTSLKMVYNLLLGLSLVSFAEALVLGESLGFSQRYLFDTLKGAAVVAPSAISKREKIEEGSYAPDFPLQWLQKDLHLAARSGFAEQDISAIYQFLVEQAKSPGP